MSNLDDYLKSIGEPPVGSKAPVPPASSGGDSARASPSPAREPGHQPSYDELDWQQKMGQGVAKAAAGVATGIPKLANTGLSLVAPGLSEKLGDLAERVPGVKRMEDFASSESEGGLETAGNVAASGAMALMGPGEWNLGEKAAEAVAKRGTTQLPGQFARGGFRSTAGDYYAPKLASLAERAARGAGNVAEGAGKGAIAGAVSDPTDPVTGAIAGGVTGGGLSGLAGALTSKAGQFTAGHAARGAALQVTEKLAASIGIPASTLWGTGIAEALVFWHSPVGKVLHAGGQKAAELMARAIVATDPRIPASAVGKIAETLLAPSTAPTSPAAEETDVEEQPRSKKH